MALPSWVSAGAEIGKAANNLIMPWLSYFETKKQNEWNRDFATQTNAQEQANWEKAFTQNQSNFENQYQITSRDMQAAGFNPMALFNGGQLNQASGAPASPDLQGSVSQRNAFSEMIQNQANLALVNAQTKKLEAEAENISEEHSWRSSENALDRDLQERMQKANIKLETWLAEYDRDTQVLVQEKDNIARELRQQSDQAFQKNLQFLQYRHKEALQKLAQDHAKELQKNNQTWESMENEFNRATQSILENMKVAAQEDRLDKYLAHDLKRYEAQLAVQWSQFGVDTAKSLSSELRSWLNTICTAGTGIGTPSTSQGSSNRIYVPSSPIGSYNAYGR